MSNSYSIVTARRQIKRVFTYLKELTHIKTPPVVDVDKYDWLFWLDLLPLYPSIIRGSDFSNLQLLGLPPVPDQESNQGNFIIKVSRPNETYCPEPGNILKNWLKPGYAKVDAKPESFLRDSFTPKGGDKETFDAVPSRVSAFDDWLNNKRQWEISERRVLDALGAFEDLFDLYGKIYRESEKYQLYAADGILVTKKDGVKIAHPILLQRVALDFNASIPEFTLRDSDDPPEIYSALLRYLGTDTSLLKQIREDLQCEHQHPFGANDTGEFLRNLVQRLWSDGQYFNNEIEAREATSSTYLYRKPHMYLGLRNHGFAEAIDRYIERIPEMESFPESLLRLVGIDTGKSEERAESDLQKLDLLLTKPANPEQERVLHRLEETGAVLVQGPPGTGKSHTIANLIGHLLAQHKSILVTSHTSKALRVVREHVSKPLQPLCVSVLQDDEDNNRQLEESISGILNYTSSTSEKKIQKRIDTLREKRNKLKREYDETRKKLLQAAEEEYRELRLGSENMIPSQAARWLLQNAEKNDWIPGSVQNENESPPLTAPELHTLYRLNLEVTAEDERYLNTKLPEEGRLPSPDDFAAHFDSLNKYDKIEITAGSDYWQNEEQSPEDINRMMASVEAAAKVFDNDDQWVNQFLEIGRQTASQRKPWIELIDFVDQCDDEFSDKEALVLSHGPAIGTDQDLLSHLDTCRAIIKHLEAGKKLKSLSRIMHRSWAPFLEIVKIESGKPSRAIHFKSIEAMLELNTQRQRLIDRWSRMMEVLDNLPLSLEELSRRPEKKLAKISGRMRDALCWYEKRWGKIQRELTDLGFDWEKFIKEAQSFNAKDDDQGVLRNAIENLLLPVLTARIEFLEWRSVEKRQDQWVAYLDEFSRKEASYEIVKQFRSSIRRVDFDQYRQTWEKLQRLHDIKDDFTKRNALLETLRSDSPDWVAALEQRQGLHGEGKLPGDPIHAWTHRLWEQKLAERAKVDLDQLQNELNELKDEIHQVTAEYVESMSWMAQIKRTGLEQQQALNGWLALNKKIGKGTGKHVRELKDEAKRTLTKCREAVPVWIMPLTRVVESFDVATSQFDVVIIDEASQCDVMGLVAFALGKEVIVVGDHEQVSPYAVGFRTDQLYGLMDEILVDIPNNHLYDAKTSVYDLARQSFGGTIRLVEHFRCVPDIIQFSNQLCYNGEIRPLRESSASRIRPALVNRKVDGEENNKINQVEAFEIVSLILAITRFKEYDDCSIGVISMVGTDQAVYIDSILRRRMTVTEYKKRRILCGNAAQFQGDERDIVFISMVNSPTDTGKPLHLRVRDDAKKVFNVAASRARNQLWLVHSLDPETDLKHNDLRLKLIHHVAIPDPETSRTPAVKAEKTHRLNSDLEREVYEALKEEKYHALTGVPVGEYLVDLVVIGKKGNRVAIQCDGDREINREELVLSLSRQMTLERLGWKFIRIRGSEFLRHPQETFAKIKRRLKKFDIQPMGFFSGKPEEDGEQATNGKELLNQVTKRAEMIRIRWKDIPSVSSVLRKSSDNEGESADKKSDTSEAAEDVIDDSRSAA